ncbi:MAG: hypothetical protein ACREOB_12410 [Thermodesulfobacteriota bacterium]
MRTKIGLWFLIIFAAATVYAEPVYLACHVIDAKGNQTRIDITLDEASQHVSYSIVDTGLTRKTTGIFSADRVFFVSNSGDLMEIQYTIDRVNLSIQRALPRLKRLDTGMCSVVQVPKNRKF